MNLKSIMVSERSQTQKDTQCKIPFFGKVKTIRTEIRSEVASGWGGGMLISTEQEENVGDVVNIFYIFIIMVATYLCLS